MKYSRADVTIFLAVMVGGLMAMGPTGGQLRAAADLGRGRHATGWCTEHLSAADGRPAYGEDYATDEASYKEDSIDGEFSTAMHDADPEAATKAQSTHADEFSTGDEVPSTDYEGMGETYGKGGAGYDASTEYDSEDYTNKGDYTDMTDDRAGFDPDRSEMASDDETYSEPSDKSDDDTSSEPSDDGQAMEPDQSNTSTDETSTTNYDCPDEGFCYKSMPPANEYTDVEAQSSADEYTDVEAQSSANEYTGVEAQSSADEYTSVEEEFSANEYTDVEAQSSADEYTSVEEESSAGAETATESYAKDAPSMESDDEPVADETGSAQTAENSMPAYDPDGYGTYPESRYGYGMGSEPYADDSTGAETDNSSVEEPDAVTETVEGGRVAPQTDSEQVSSDQDSILEQKYGYGYRESQWEEKYGYAEEMRGQADERFAGAAERADEQSIANMENADESLTNADKSTETNEFDRGEANEQGQAMDYRWDGGPNEADLERSEDMPSENNDPVRDEAKPTEGLDLFGYLPSHLLIRPDQELLRELRQLADQSSVERQVAFNQYVESLGSEAIEFAAQYENVTGSEATTLADDVAASAAFLAVYRLYEQGEMGIDEAIDLVERTLDNLSREWVEGVEELTSDPGLDPQPTVSLEPMTDRASASAPRKLWEALSSWAGQWKVTFYGVLALRVRGLDWHGLVSLASGDADAYHLD